MNKRGVTKITSDGNEKITAARYTAIVAMKLALFARITLNLRRLFSEKWEHDMAHAFADAHREILRKEAPLPLQQNGYKPATNR